MLSAKAFSGSLPTLRTETPGSRQCRRPDWRAEGGERAEASDLRGGRLRGARDPDARFLGPRGGQGRRPGWAHLQKDFSHRRRSSLSARDCFRPVRKTCGPLATKAGLRPGDGGAVQNPFTKTCAVREAT